MAIVFALLIIGWMVAFALGNQAGFSAQPESPKPAVQPTVTASSAASDYRKPASVS